LILKDIIFTKNKFVLIQFTVAILLGAKLRPRYPDLRVYAFSTPAGVLSREAARYTEQYAFTIGIGDDFVMRLSIDAVENLRTSIIETLKACKLPKVFHYKSIISIS
jgi:sn1-specific diacylglycerol lipase